MELGRISRLAIPRITLLCGFLMLTASALAQPAFRGVWADAFHGGFKSESEVDTLIARAKTGNYNAIVAEVLAYQDSGTDAHGAYWNSNIVPKATDVTAGFDPLAYLCQQAHAEGIEVHAWLVTFRVSTSWPPNNNATISAHPEWINTAVAGMGNGPSTLDGKYILDAGSPDVQEYLVGIVRELVTNYPIDGINWDYVRYTQADAGYPTSNSYANSGLARFRRITGYSGTPGAADTAWSDFRRRTINELVRRCRAEIPAITSNPRQPLRHTADLIGSGDAPSDFTNSSAYGLFQNWQLWMQMGWLDAGIPMNYKDDRNATHAQWYRNWVDAAVGWRGARHMFCGQGNYMNSKANSVAQLQYVQASGADGSCNYSYYSTADENNDEVEEADFTWYPYVAANVFTSPVPTPTMPWRNPATAAEGTLWGRVTASVGGGPIDDAAVQVGGLGPVQTDGNGYYTVTLIPTPGGAAACTVTATDSGYTPGSATGVQVVAGGLRRQDFVLVGPLAPVIAEVSPDPGPAVVGTPYTMQLTLTTGTADTWTLLEGPGGAVVSGSGYVSGWTPAAADAGQLRTFRVRAANSAGSDEEIWQVSVSQPPTCADILITGFEDYVNDTEVVFQEPQYSATSIHLAATPDVRGVTDEVTPFTGQKCYKLSWQYLDSSTTRYARITTSNASNVPNPTIELNKPLRIRLRLDSGSLRVCLGLRETGTSADVGGNGGNTGTIEWVGATGKIGSAPQGRLVSAWPGVWQTLVFYPGRDPILAQTGDGILSSATGKGTIEQLTFSSTGSAGPFTVYIDSIEQLCTLPATPRTDFDNDGDVDALDLNKIRSCALGASILQNTSTCLAARLDADTDVDLDDFGIFQRCLRGPNIPADPACAD